LFPGWQVLSPGWLIRELRQQVLWQSDSLWWLARELQLILSMWMQVQPIVFSAPGWALVQRVKLALAVTRVAHGK
jgi:hypothetical protein